jgi:hypothetical protein
MSEWGWKQLLLGAFLLAWVGVIVVADCLMWRHDRKRRKSQGNALSEHSGDHPDDDSRS